ncbi:MAG: DUF2791 family P-loop domain-containing protein [Mesotoga sp.]|uniref:BREX system ATP-binding domain-containing protein n=1 Tax=Mesotoga sp. TaxID=2053577 RepID=UPI00263311B0|nr:BREX system ATP-binding domain-containing protein [Mesotoga sp.]MDD4826970.1 DUF2791 family P-loop domain-containing protein [Mesotoga sp.]
MDQRPMLEAIRVGVAIPKEYIGTLIVGRKMEKKLIEDDVDYVLTYGRSKVRIFLGAYGYGKTTLAKYAIKVAGEKAFLYSSLSEKDYKGFYKQDELFRSIMKNLRYYGYDGNPIGIILDNWVDETKEKGQHTVEYISREQLPSYLTRDQKMPAGFFTDFSAAYLFNSLNKLDTRDLISYIQGDKIDKRALRRHGINHFLEDDGWNFLKGFVSLIKNMKFPGLLLIMDELENLRSNRRDLRDKTYNQLREILDRLLGGDINGIHCIWLGTMDWFEDQVAGVKSYTALYERIRREINEFQTRESVVLQLTPMARKELEELVDLLIKIYRETYSTDFSQEERNAILKEALERFTNLNNEISVSPRQLIKWVVDVLDITKEKPEDLSLAIRSVAERVVKTDNPYEDLF